MIYFVPPTNNIKPKGDAPWGMVVFAVFLLLSALAYIGYNEYLHPVIFD